MMRRVRPALRPLICTLLLAVPLALLVIWAIEHYYQVPLAARASASNARSRSACWPARCSC